MPTKAQLEDQIRTLNLKIALIERGRADSVKAQALAQDLQKSLAEAQKEICRLREGALHSGEALVSAAKSIINLAG